MADLLRSGNTMLNMACPVCNNPIFRNKGGNIFCPTCNRNIKIVNDISYKEKPLEKKEINQEEQEKSAHIRKKELFFSIQEVLFEKIEIITKKLRDETQLQTIEKYTRILFNCLEILNKIPFRKED